MTGMISVKATLLLNRTGQKESKMLAQGQVPMTLVE